MDNIRKLNKSEIVQKIMILLLYLLLLLCVCVFSYITYQNLYEIDTLKMRLHILENKPDLSSPDKTSDEKENIGTNEGVPIEP